MPRGAARARRSAGARHLCAGAILALAAWAAPPAGTAAGQDPAAPDSSVAADTGSRWVITGERLEGNRIGITTLTSPRAVQDTVVVTAEEGYWYRDDERLVLTGEVRIVEPHRTLRADRGTYDLRDEIAILTGNVAGDGPEGSLTSGELRYERNAGRIDLLDRARVVDGTQVLEADRILYDTKAATATATGHVVIRDEKDRTFVTGERADMDRRNDTAVVTGSPHLERPDEAGDGMLRVTADTLGLDRPGRMGEALGSVRILRENVTAEAGRALFDLDGDRLKLQRSPVVVDPDGRVTGDSMAILVARGRAERLEVLGNARVFYEPSNKPGEENHVLGDTLIAFLDSLGMRELRVRGRARSLYLPSPKDRNEDVGSNLARGARIDVDIVGGEAREVRLIGGATGEYVLPRERPDTSVVPVPDSVYHALAREHFLRAGDRAIPDSLERRGPFDPLERVVYAGDTVTFHVPSKRIAIRGNGSVKYQQLTLDSSEIDYDATKDRVTALGKPGLADQESRLVGTRMVYRMDRRQGFAYQGRTEFDGGFYYGEEIKRVDNKILLVKQGDYTTCSADTAHYHFHADRMKIALGDKVVARPIILYIRKIPIMALPYWVFPVRKGRHSGILVPNIEFGFDQRRGRFVRNLGYYVAPNDYMDAMFWGDFYEQSTRWIGKSQVRYKLRNRLDGNLYGSYSGQEDVGGKKRRWDLKGSHSQTLAEKTTLTMRADFVSDKDYRGEQDFGESVDERLNRTLRSDLDVRKTWSRASLAVTADRTENLDADSTETQVSMNLPRIDFNMNSFPVGVQPDDRGRNGRLPFLSTLYVRLSSSYRSVFSKPWGKPTSDQQAAAVRGGITDNRKLGPLKFAPSVSGTTAWFRRDALGEAHAVGAVWSLGASASTTVYGTFPIDLGPLLALRHVIEPSASYSYSPEFESLRTVDADGDEINRYPSVGGISLSGAKVNSISFSMQQRFHMKTEGDDPKKPNKIDNLILWSTSTSYNFLKKGDKPFASISNNVRLQPARYFESNLNLAHDPYKRRMTSLSLRTSVRISGQGGGGRPDSTGDAGLQYGDFGQGGVKRNRPGEDDTEVIGGTYNVSLSHSYSRGISRSSEQQSLDISATASPTNRWNVSYSIYFDAKDWGIKSQGLSLIRDLHCWQAEFTRQEYGGNSQYYFRVFLRDIPDVKYERERR